MNLSRLFPRESVVGIQFQTVEVRRIAEQEIIAVAMGSNLLQEADENDPKLIEIQEETEL